jgi:uncharacterized protein DUF664
VQSPDFSISTERAALGGFLDLQRDGLIRKIQGASDADARRPLSHRRSRPAWSWMRHARRTDLADRNLRWVLLHLIEETARHAGHADIIRETLDGTRGM